MSVCMQRESSQQYCLSDRAENLNHRSIVLTGVKYIIEATTGSHTSDKEQIDYIAPDGIRGVQASYILCTEGPSKSMVLVETTVGIKTNYCSSIPLHKATVVDEDSIRP